MKRAFFLMPIIYIMGALPAAAQDVMPAAPTLDHSQQRSDSVRFPHRAWNPAWTDTLALQPLPTAGRYGFIRPDRVRLRGSEAARRRLVAALALQASGVRFVHIGDSHVKGKVFPATCGRLLESTFDSLHSAHFGINGATCASFSTDERLAAVAQLSPDVLLISFGTNEGHDVSLSEERFLGRFNEFVCLVRSAFPGVPLIFTTPPGAYYKGRPNRHNVLIARALADYCEEQGLLCFDLQEACGGAEAAANWRRSGLLRSDGVHFTVDGYRVHGELTYAAIVNSYNEIVSRQ